MKCAQVGSTAQPVQRPVQPVQSSARTPSQVADDEALARRLQEQLLALVGSVEGWAKRQATEVATEIDSQNFARCQRKLSGGVGAVVRWKGYFASCSKMMYIAISETCFNRHSHFSTVGQLQEIN